MPQFESLHSERAILASILQRPDCLIELNGKVDISAFKNPVNRALVSLSIKLYNDGFTRFDNELFQSKLISYPLPDGVDLYQIQNYVSALFAAHIEPVNFSNYLEELNESHLKDSLNQLLMGAIEELPKHKPASMVMSSLQTAMHDLDAGMNRNDDPVDIASGFGETLYGLIDKPKVGIPSGIDILDEMTLGWIPKKFYFIGARPGRGKSAFLLQCAAYAAFFAKEKRVPVLYLDTEIDGEEFKIRLAGHLAGVDTKIIQQGLWQRDPRQRENVEKAIKFVEREGGIYHKELPGYNIANVISIIRKYVHNYNVGLVIFDYIEEPADDGDKKARWEKVGLVARTLKQYAQTLEIPVVAALQLNREGEERSRVSAKAYAESDDVFKKADGAFALNKKSAEEIRKETIQAGTHRLQILKGRYMAVSYSGLNLRYLGYCLRFLPAQIQYTDVSEAQNDTPSVTTCESGIPQIAEYDTGPLV